MFTGLILGSVHSSGPDVSPAAETSSEPDPGLDGPEPVSGERAGV